MLNIEITGLSGFVGENLKSYLMDNFNVRGLSIRFSKQSTVLFSSNHIIHLAGKAHDLKNVSQPSDYYEANFELTRQLYNAFLKSDAKKFIFISSVKAVSDTVEGVLIETQVPNPQTHYGKSKLLAEEYIQSQVLPEGKSYYIIRPCMIHGPGNKGNLNLLYKLVSMGIPYPLAAFKNKRSFLSVENLCFIIKEILIRDNIPSGIYNAADDTALSTNEVVSILSKAISRKPKLLFFPSRIVNAIAVIGDKLGLPLNSERLKKLTENFVVSNQKIKDVLKKDLPLSAEEGIYQTAIAFKTSNSKDL